MTEEGGALPPAIQRWVEALTWHETLTEAREAQLTSTAIQAWQAWYADPANQRLFELVSQLVCESRLHRERSGRWNADIIDDGYDPAVPIALWKKMTTSRIARRRRRSSPKPWLWLTGVVAAAATVAFAAWIPWPDWIAPASHEGDQALILQTNVDGLKNVHLSDGSDITLGGRTELRVALSPRVRSVELLHGEAWFRVAHDPKWPFVVHAGEGAIRAVGTAFLVTRDSDRVVVTVTEGTVAVTTSPLVDLTSIVDQGAASLQRPAPIRVIRGQEVSYRDNGMAASVVSADVHAATAWIDGRLIFNDEPLRYVIENVNRYFPRHISATPSAGRLRFSGVILDGQIEGWLHGLPGIFSVAVDEGGGEICVHMRPSHDDSRCGTAR